MAHILKKHSEYVVLDNINDIMTFTTFTNGDKIKDVYIMQDGILPSIEGFSEYEIQKLFNKTTKGK